MEIKTWENQFIGSFTNFFFECNTLVYGSYIAIVAGIRHIKLQSI